MTEPRGGVYNIARHKSGTKIKGTKKLLNNALRSVREVD